MTDPVQTVAADVMRAATADATDVMRAATAVATTESKFVTYVKAHTIGLAAIASFIVGAVVGKLV
jgi:hypothetical protein